MVHTWVPVTPPGHEQRARSPSAHIASAHWLSSQAQFAPEQVVVVDPDEVPVWQLLVVEHHPHPSAAVQALQGDWAAHGSVQAQLPHAVPQRLQVSVPERPPLQVHAFVVPL
jgi:hypothetical protein